MIIKNYYLNNYSIDNFKLNDRIVTYNKSKINTFNLEFIINNSNMLVNYLISSLNNSNKYKSPQIKKT